MILEKALELSKLIKNSDELQKYKDAKKVLSEKPALEHDLDYYMNLLESLDAAEIPFENLEEEQRDEIEELEKMFAASTEVRNYLASEAELKEILQMIKKIINQGINN